MRAVQLTAYGNLVEGLKYVDIPAPDAPGPNQVLIGVEFSPINPSDLMLAKGFAGLVLTVRHVPKNQHHFRL
jgi:NADPH:quinone reductase-like Zn-dependent oxidoreductase